MKILLNILVPLWAISSFAQETLSLQTCYDLVQKNYPLAKQTSLLEHQNALDQEVISKSQLPQLDLSAQATYQSDVTEVPIPNSNITPLNKDQYRATLTMNQLIYNGGLIEASSDLKNTQLQAKTKQVEVNLYQLKQRVNQLYFSILLLQEKKSLLDAKQNQLESKLKEVRSGIENGVILPRSDKVLEAELIKLKQNEEDIDSNKTVLLQTLSSLIDEPIEFSTSLEKPLIKNDTTLSIKRPELDLFQLKKQEIDNNEMVLSKQNAPKLLGFATGGYGNPGLNMLDNSFQPFYIVGLKLNWNVFDWNANKKQRESLAVNKDIIDNETSIFNLNTEITLNKQEKEIKKIEGFIKSDLKLIALRTSILETADSQLKNGVITSSDYITELTNLYEDENTLATHQINLQLAKANYNLVQGQ